MIFMDTLVFGLLLFTLSVPNVHSHMSLQYPHPRDTLNGVSYAVWEQNEPMWTVHASVCHGLDEDDSVRSGNAFKAGDLVELDIYGTATHAGGHCAFWWTSDTSSNFNKIIDIVDCTLLDTVQVMMPYTMSTECETKCTFAWSWVPYSSGACEIYMNCAEISVSGVTGISSTDTSITLSFEDMINSGDPCERVDDSTHLTTVFNTVKLDYTSDDTAGGTGTDTGTDTGGTTADTSTGTTGSTGVTDITDVVTDECMNDNAYNLDGVINNDGTCGSDNCVDCRCDDEQCCSSGGYCGPEFAGYNSITGESLYYYYDSTETYYASSEEAYAAYCTNNLGDWRLVDCDTTGTGTDSGTTGDIISTSDNIIIENADGISEWWYALYITNLPDGYDIDSVYLKDSQYSDYYQGDASSWGPYVFTEGFAWTLPFSITIQSTSGEVIYGNDIVTDVEGLSTFDFGSTFGNSESSRTSVSSGKSVSSESGTDTNTNNLENEMTALEWSLAILGGVVAVFIIVCAICYYQNKKHKKQIKMNDNGTQNGYVALIES